jgi:hypothetical protein
MFEQQYTETKEFEDIFENFSDDDSNDDDIINNMDDWHDGESRGSSGTVLSMSKSKAIESRNKGDSVDNTRQSGGKYHVNESMLTTSLLGDNKYDSVEPTIQQIL